MLGMHNINLTLAKCGKLPGTLAIFTVLGPVRPHTIPFYHPFYPDVTHKKRYQAFSHFSVLQAIFIPRYSVHKSEESQPTEHIGEHVHFLFNDCCYKCLQGRNHTACLFSTKIACTKCVPSVVTHSLFNE